MPQQTPAVLHAPCDILGAAEKAANKESQITFSFVLFAFYRVLLQKEQRCLLLYNILYSLRTIDNECMYCRERGPEQAFSVLLGVGVASYSSLWIGSTDLRTHSETVTKLEKEIDKDRNRETFSSEDLLFVPPSSFSLLCLP